MNPWQPSLLSTNFQFFSPSPSAQKTALLGALLWGVHLVLINEGEAGAQHIPPGLGNKLSVHDTLSSLLAAMG